MQVQLVNHQYLDLGPLSSGGLFLLGQLQDESSAVADEFCEFKTFILAHTDYILDHLFCSFYIFYGFEHLINVKKFFIKFAELQSGILVRYQLIFSSMQRFSNLFKTYPQRREHASDGLKVHSQGCYFPTKGILEVFMFSWYTRLVKHRFVVIIAIGSCLNRINTPITWLGDPYQT